MKLVDQVADFQSAVDDTAKAVGIRGEPVLVRPEKDRKTLGDLIVWRCFGVDPDPRKADGSARWVLLHVEVEGQGRVLGLLGFRLWDSAKTVRPGTFC